MKPTPASRLRASVALCFGSLLVASAFAPGCALQPSHNLAFTSHVNHSQVVGTQGSTAAARREAVAEESGYSAGGRTERGIPTPQPAREGRDREMVALPTPQPPLPDRPLPPPPPTDRGMPSFGGRGPGAVGRYASW